MWTRDHGDIDDEKKERKKYSQYYVWRKIMSSLDLRWFLFSFQIRFFAFSCRSKNNFTFFHSTASVREMRWWEGARRNEFWSSWDHALEFLPNYLPKNELKLKSFLFSKLWPIKLPIHNLDEQQREKRDFWCDNLKTFMTV